MNTRANFYTASLDAMKAMMALETAVGGLGLEALLLELVKLRASQINGCAFCVDTFRRRPLSNLRRSALLRQRFYLHRHYFRIRITSRIQPCAQHHEWCFNKFKE